MSLDKNTLHIPVNHVPPGGMRTPREHEDNQVPSGKPTPERDCRGKR